MAPPDYSFVTDIEVREQRSKKTRDEDHADGTTSDCNLEDDEEKYNSDDEDYLPDFNQLEPLSIAQLPPYIPSTSPPTQIPIAQLPALWYQHLSVFFEPVASPHSFQRSPEDVIDAYCQMRDLPEHDWKSPTFQETLTSSGLLAQLKWICRLGNLIETSHPDVERSFRVHDWKISFAELIGRWNEATIDEAEYARRRPREDPEYEFKHRDVHELFQFISTHKRMHPWGYNPFTAYFLLSESCFRFYSDTWLAPCLRTLNYPKIEGWNPKKVHRIILETPLLRDAESEKSRVFLGGLDNRLATVIRETSAYRQVLKRAKTEAHRAQFPPSSTSTSTPTASSSTSAPTGLNKKKAKHTDKKKKAAASPLSHNAKVAAAKQAKTLQPKRRDGLATKPHNITFVNPEELDLTWVRPRPEAFNRCGKDITRFIWEKDGRDILVGGVRYGGMSDETLGLLIENHRRVTVRGVRRREAMQAWAYGTMTAAGARQPMGGVKGDVYGPYACHRGDTPDDIRALFRHAVDCDVLVEFGTSIIPSLRSDINAMTNTDDVLRMGRHVHEDRDVGLEDVQQRHASKECIGGCYPCVQLEQTGTDKSKHEWDFCYLGFGLVIETQSNTIWCFNGRVRHASIMPGHNSYHNNHAMSSGKHPTKRERDAARAAVIARIRHAMNLRP
ncbi:hypothetical protein B0H16DRAFT_1480741 [Mycena metata]|uniref:Uncharacterized protein n=1 Tax=Mycena metata TaxID=1033252 RepID=A0AAD7MCK5_9AGAR|nr:hypothetical protein B0H16DRAFT_1480741 [Mycena metata]